MTSNQEIQQKLHLELKEMLGSNNVYYQSTTNISMSYPAIKYELSKSRFVKANDGNYLKHNVYDLIVITKNPDIAVIDKLTETPYCTFDRVYISDNLYHYSFTLYY